MSESELKDVLNLLSTMYPTALKDINVPQRREQYIEIYAKQIGTKEFVDVKEALYLYQRENTNNYPPTMKDIIDLTNKCKVRRQSKVESTARRIITPEEDCSNEYEEIMRKVDSGKIEITQELHDYLLRLKPYYLLFHGDGWQERYKKRFGKSREEFERL